MESIRSTNFLSVLFTNCIQSWLILFFFKLALNKLEIAIFDLKASLPPLKIAAFPDLKLNTDTSEVTFGLAS